MEKRLQVALEDAQESVRIPTSTYILSLCQAINLVAAVLSVTVAAVVGAKLAPSPELATVPYGLQFAAVMLFTYPASMFMRRYGRRAGFLLGSTFLGAAGCVGYLAVASSSFMMLSLAHFLLGTYIAFANFYRFAAVDNIRPELKAKAISLVVSGGVLAAVIGPLLAIQLRDLPGFKEYSLCYGVLLVLCAASLGLNLLRSNSDVTTRPAAIAESPRERQTLSFPVFVAIFSAASGYLVMNFLMIQSSLAMKEMQMHFNASSHAIQLHVLAMFVPSFFTGHLIARFGVRLILFAGFLFLAGSAVSGLMLQGYESMVLGLILLGLGWNFTYVGGGALLTQHIDDKSRHAWQGINDVVIAVCATLGALSPAMLLSVAGWRGSNLVCLVITVAGLAICMWPHTQRR